jgi:transcriptional regulator with XRE-family HTH domain
MPYAAEYVIAALRAARVEKRLSQRDLSGRAGLPQSHVSRIESGAVDLQLSSLIKLARVLDLEIMPIPRKLVPAVQAITRRSESIVHGGTERRSVAVPAYTLDGDDDA